MSHNPKDDLEHGKKPEHPHPPKPTKPNEPNQDDGEGSGEVHTADDPGGSGSNPGGPGGDPKP